VDVDALLATAGFFRKNGVVLNPQITGNSMAAAI
jgi:hypothetical protein